MLNNLFLFKATRLGRRLNAENETYLNFNISMSHLLHDIQGTKMQSG